MDLRLRAPADYFPNPMPCTAFADTRAKLEADRGGTLIDLAQLRAMQDWSYLNGRVVGAEEPSKY